MKLTDIKGMYCDLDDTFVKSSPFIQRAIEENTEYNSLRLSVLEQMYSSCKFIYDENARRFEQGKIEEIIPEFIATVKVGCNDIIRETSNDDEKDNLSLGFEKAYLSLAHCCKAMVMAKQQLEMFMENRDHCLEEDNLKDKNYIVDYAKHLIEENIIDDSLQLLLSLVDMGIPVSFLTSQNGLREDKAKRDFCNRVTNGKVGYLSLRFHSEEFDGVHRRPRSDKAECAIREIYKLSKEQYPILDVALNDLGITKPLEGILLIDDSIANLNMWVKYGGNAILYRPLSDEERITGELIPHDGKFPRMTEMTMEAFIKALEFYSDEKAAQCESETKGQYCKVGASV